MGLLNSISDNLERLIHPNQATRYQLHGEGIKGVTDDSIADFRKGISETVDYVADKTSPGTGRALGAAGTLLAIGAGLALSEVIVVGAVAYYVGRKMGEVGTRRFREEAHKALGASDFN